MTKKKVEEVYKEVSAEDMPQEPKKTVNEDRARLHRERMQEIVLERQNRERRLEECKNRIVVLKRLLHGIPSDNTLSNFAQYVENPLLKWTLTYEKIKAPVDYKPTENDDMYRWVGCYGRDTVILGKEKNLKRILFIIAIRQGSPRQGSINWKAFFDIDNDSMEATFKKDAWNEFLAGIDAKRKEIESQILEAEAEILRINKIEEKNNEKAEARAKLAKLAEKHYIGWVEEITYNPETLDQIRHASYNGHRVRMLNGVDARDQILDYIERNKKKFVGSVYGELLEFLRPEEKD